MTTSLMNLRDVGGMPLSGGGRVRTGVLLRGDAPKFGDAPVRSVAWPPRTVVDLRSTSEQDEAHALASASVAVHRTPLSADLDLTGAAGHELVPPGGLPGLYRQTLRDAGHRIAEAAALVSDAPGPVLVHCAAGKDRTGLVVAAILAAVGVPREDIVADYVLTEANMEGVLVRMASEGPAARVIEAVRVSHPDLFAAPAEAIEVALDVFDEAGGSSEWLVSQGLDRGALERLRRRLTAP